MKKVILSLAVLVMAIVSCGTLQSIVKSTLPYTANLVIPASTSLNTTQTAISPASSFDQVFTGQGTNTDKINQVRVTSVKLESTNPSDQSLGILKSARVYLVNGNSEVMVGSRSDIAATVGNAIMLDIDNSKFLDDYIKSNQVKVKLEYVLQSGLSVDLSLRASIGLSASPVTAN